MRKRGYLKYVITGILMTMVFLCICLILSQSKTTLEHESDRGKERTSDGWDGWIHNAYILNNGGNTTISFLYQKKTYSFPGRTTNACEGVADLFFEQGEIRKIQTKPEKIEGILQRYTDSSVSISGYEDLLYEGELPVYMVCQNQMQEGMLSDLIVGTSKVSLVVAQGKACAIIKEDDDYVECIRVLIKNKKKLFYEKLYITCDADFQAEHTSYREPVSYPKNEIINAGKLLSETNGGTVCLKMDGKEGLFYLCDKKGNSLSDGYPGNMYFYRDEEGIVLVNEVPIETYLRYVLPSEMPTYFSYEALKAQAVCARTFAYKQMTNTSYAKYGANLDNSTAFQVYHAKPTYEITDRAVRDTDGMVLVHNRELIDCYYYSTSPGYGEDLKIWGADSPDYLVSGNLTKQETKNLSYKKEFHTFITSMVDSYDSESPYYRWNAVLSTKMGMDEKYGRLKEIVITDRSESGFVLSMKMIFEKGEREFTKENDIRFALSRYLVSVTLEDGRVLSDFGSLPSAAFEISKQEKGIIQLNGGGFGHGIGMSQYGANGLAKEGYTWKEILQYYYKNVEICRWNKGDYPEISE